MAKKTDGFAAIKRDILSKKFAKVYFLHGEESYYIDTLTQLLLDNVLTEDEKDFNLTQFYGADTTIGDVISACRRYPMMAERQLVLLREAQMMDARSSKLDDLEHYLEHPLDSTVLVVCYKTKSYDARKKVVKMAAAEGVVYESKKVRDYELPPLVNAYLQEAGLTIDDRALQTLCENVGTDLTRLFSEVDKLRITLKGNRIGYDQVVAQIGISKEYNNWELQSAIANRDLRKIELIRRYYARNPKANPYVVTLTVLFNFFSNLMLAHYSEDKTEQGLMTALHLSNPYATRDYRAALKIYNAWKTMYNIALIREYDAKNKGARGCAQPEEALMQELLFKLVH
jgi:DNA polymerase-3 subunit delta